MQNFAPQKLFSYKRRGMYVEMNVSTVGDRLDIISRTFKIAILFSFPVN